MSKKAAIYARVSSQRQKEGETINSQVDALRLYAQQEDYLIPDNWIFLDDGVSGKTLQRPALDELRDMIRTEPLEAVLIYAPDRLARSYPYQLILLEEFRKNGIKVCFLKGPQDGNTPEAVMFNHFQGIFAEYERGLILDRSRRGRIHKAKQGDPAILPNIAYGYKRVKNGRTTTIEVVEEHASVVREIFRLYIYENMPLRRIARLLSDKGLKTPKGNTTWEMTTIRDFLKNTAYIGTAYYGKTERCDGKSNRIRRLHSQKYIQPKYARNKLPEERWMPIAMPAIISEHDFELAQVQITKNIEHASRNTKEPSLLQGLVTCGECGYPCYKRFRKYKETHRSYYQCRSQCDSGFNRCKNGLISQPELDSLVYEEVINLLQNPTLIKEELSRRAKEVSNDNDIERQTILYNKELGKLSEGRDRLLDAYQSGVLNIEELKKRNQIFDDRRNTLVKEIKAMEAQKLSNGNHKDIDIFFKRILERMKVSANDLPLNEKQKLVRLLVEEIIVDRENIKIVHCIAIKSPSEDFSQLRGDGVAFPRGR